MPLFARTHLFIKMKEHCCVVVVAACDDDEERKKGKNMFTTVDSSFIKSLPRACDTNCEKCLLLKKFQGRLL